MQVPFQYFGNVPGYYETIDFTVFFLRAPIPDPTMVSGREGGSPIAGRGV
jgi:hypothetical protein